MAKQDRQGARNVPELVQRYNFGKSFAELMGLVQDAQRAAGNAQESVNQLDKEFTAEEIFNRLTNNGEEQGIYREGEKIYVNASYINTGTMLADLIKAGVLQSKDGTTFYLDLTNGVLKGKFSELVVSGKSVDEIAQEKADEAEANSLSALNDYSQTVTKSLEGLQAQLDGQIETWFYSHIPTTTNLPASEWTTETDKNNHLGDLFYVVDNEEANGATYRWALVNGTYTWVIVEDTDVAKALADAAKAQDTADNKRRVFVTTPAPPYDRGDLWTDGADLRVCNVARISGNYTASDWILATDYIDREKAAEIAQEKVDSQTQTDIFNKLTNNGKVVGLFMEDGQLYINASYLSTGVLASKDGESFYLDLDNGTLKGKFSELTIKSKTVDEIAQEKANTAESNAKAHAVSTAASAVKAQTQADIFNKLTNNGSLLGLFMENGQLYINASYLKSGKISADLIDVDSLVAKKLASEVGINRLVIDSAQLQFFRNGKDTITMYNDLTGYGNANPVIYLTDYASDGSYKWTSWLHCNELVLCGIPDNPYGKIRAYVDEWDNNRPHIEIDRVDQDYIVEQSTSGIWTYKKWASGIKECWGNVTHTVTVNRAWGSLYESAAVGNIDFPFTFDSVPTMQLSVVGTSGNSVFLEYPYGTAGSTTVSNTGKWHYVRPDAINTSFKVTTAIRVIGK